MIGIELAVRANARSRELIHAHLCNRVHCFENDFMAMRLLYRKCELHRNSLFV